LCEHLRLCFRQARHALATFGRVRDAVLAGFVSCASSTDSATEIEYILDRLGSEARRLC